jgi:hypothetical protein
MKRHDARLRVDEWEGHSKPAFAQARAQGPQVHFVTFLHGPEQRHGTGASEWSEGLKTLRNPVGPFAARLQRQCLAQAPHPFAELGLHTSTQDVFGGRRDAVLTLWRHFR